MILLFGGEKGGTGKTTAAVNMAAMRARQGRDVLLIDSDKQGSASLWAAIRVQESLSPSLACIAIYGETLDEQVRKLKDRFDDIVIDTRGSDAPELRSAMLVADLMITPARASQFDIFTLGAVDKLVAQARGFNKSLRAAILINCAPTHVASTEVDEMKEVVAELSNYSLLNSVIKDRKIFRTCAKDGMAVTEYDKPDEKAVFEITQLAKEVWK